jgi:hypothetical protein
LVVLSSFRKTSRFRGRLQFVQKPLNQSFSPDETGSIVYIENAQTAVRTLRFVNGLARTGSGLKAANAAYQPVEGSRVIEGVGEFDPGRGNQKCGQAATLSPPSAGQENSPSRKDFGRAKSQRLTRLFASSSRIEARKLALRRDYF